MGVPDDHDEIYYNWPWQNAQVRNLLVYCSNPDLASPQEKGLVASPGAIAATYEEMTREVVFNVKPHAKVFASMQEALGKGRILMVGDSLEHDIAGAKNIGWDSVLVTGGLYAKMFEDAQPKKNLEDLLHFTGCPAPDSLIHKLS